MLERILNTLQDQSNLHLSLTSVYPLIFECIALRSVTQLDKFTQQLSDMYANTFLIVFYSFPSKYIKLTLCENSYFLVGRLFV